MKTPTASLVLALLSLPVAAQGEVEFAESFEGGSNAGAWSWGTGGQSTVPLNGNPGAYLQDLTLFSFLPTFRTAPGVPSPYVGDYQAMGVRRLGVDLITLDTDFGIGQRFLTLELANDNGTPQFFDDDWGAYFITDQLIPDPGVPIDAGWQSYDVDVPSQSEGLPLGWSPFGGLGAPGNPTFGDLMRDVDRVAFLSGSPGVIYLLLSWDVGADNPRIAVTDCDGDGTPNFQQIAGGAPDLDGDGTLDGCQSLSGDGVELSVGAGGSVGFALTGAPGNAHLLLGSVTGTTPGVPLGAVILPLVPDAYTDLTLASPNTPPLSNSFGFFDASGASTASFSLPAGTSPAFAGLTAHHAFLELDLGLGAVASASNAWPTALQP